VEGILVADVVVEQATGDARLLGQLAAVVSV